MLDRLKESLHAWEGVTPHLYLDTNGYVTCGIGHMLASPEDACALSWERGATGVAATPAEVMQEYHRVLATERGKIASYYAAKTVLRLPKEAITALLDSDIAEKQAEVAPSIPGFSALPEPVQVALLDMAFNMGVHTLTSGFPQMMKLVAERDWAAIGHSEPETPTTPAIPAPCHRRDVAESRNAWTAKLFLEAAAPRT